LGLSVTYGITRPHGGAIEVRLTEGQGAIFEMELPSLARASNGGSYGQE